MRIEHGKIGGDLAVTEQYRLHGMVTGSTSVVGPSGHLDLHGMVCKDLTIEQGGSVDLHGMVNGNVINRGGRLSVFGTILGTLRTPGGGRTSVNPGSVVHGGIMEEGRDSTSPRA